MSEWASFDIYTDPDCEGKILYKQTWLNFMNDHPPNEVFHRADERIKDWKGVRVGDRVEFETEQDMMFFILRWS
jgi:hypothetical protein